MALSLINRKKQTGCFWLQDSSLGMFEHKHKDTATLNCIFRRGSQSGPYSQELWQSLPLLALSICLSICLSIYLSVCLPFCNLLPLAASWNRTISIGQKCVSLYIIAIWSKCRGSISTTFSRSNNAYCRGRRAEGWRDRLKARRRVSGSAVLRSLKNYQRDIISIFLTNYNEAVWPPCIYIYIIFYACICMCAHN